MLQKNDCSIAGVSTCRPKSGAAALDLEGACAAAGLPSSAKAAPTMALGMNQMQALQHIMAVMQQHLPAMMGSALAAFFWWQVIFAKQIFNLKLSRPSGAGAPGAPTVEASTSEPPSGRPRSEEDERRHSEPAPEPNRRSERDRDRNRDRSRRRRRCGEEKGKRESE